MEDWKLILLLSHVKYQEPTSGNKSDWNQIHLGSIKIEHNQIRLCECNHLAFGVGEK
jgi:hypothetical protein